MLLQIKKNDIIIFVREYSEIENEIISMFNFIFSKMLSKQNEVLNSVISERIQNKTKFKKALENFSNNFIKNIEKSEKQYGIIKHGNLNQITISDPMDIHNNNIAVRKLLHFI